MDAKVTEEIKKAGINKQCNTQANDKDMANLSETVCEAFIYVLYSILKKLTLDYNSQSYNHS